jgi:hypothetical protein
MVVGFTTTYAISAYHHFLEYYDPKTFGIYKSSLLET